MNSQFKKNLTINSKYKIIFKLLLCFGYYFFMQNVFACGYYLESPCKLSSPCRSELGLELDAVKNACIFSAIKNKTWKTYPIDDSRDNNENCNGMNCWKYDDIVKNKLNMDSSQLEYSEQIFGNKQPSLELRARETLRDGRYIYVIRTSDGKMVIRHYDQEYATTNVFPLIVRFDYARFRNPHNYRTQDSSSKEMSPCTPLSLLPVGATCNYLHVRHSQLNGTKPALDDSYQDSDAWDPVYCAGELRVHNSKIDRINNDSEYFKPNPACVSNVVLLLKALGISMDKHMKAGDYHKISTSEVFDCKNSPKEMVPDIPDNPYHACGYIIFSQSPIGGLLAMPIYKGKSICAHRDIIWIWSHSHNCNGQIYSRGAEH